MGSLGGSDGNTEPFFRLTTWLPNPGKPLSALVPQFTHLWGEECWLVGPGGLTPILQVRSSGWGPLTCLPTTLRSGGLFQACGSHLCSEISTELMGEGIGRYRCSHCSWAGSHCEHSVWVVWLGHPAWDPLGKSKAREGHIVKLPRISFKVGEFSKMGGEGALRSWGWGSSTQLRPR